MNSKLLFYLFLLVAASQIFSPGGRLSMMLHQPLDFIFLLLSILIALVIHEFCHALAADRLGDPNPRIAGRVSLNPLAHLDPFGTILIIVTGFGWGKPVSFDPYNLQDPAKDGALIAAAGPLSNIGLAVICALILRFLALPMSPTTLTIINFIVTLFSVNLSLAIFNLLPFYPLDGHHIIRAFLPRTTRASYDLFNRHFGMFLAFILIIPWGGTSLVSYLMTPHSQLRLFITPWCLMLVLDHPDHQVHHYQVGPLQTNCYFFTYSPDQHTIIIDPGDDGDFLSEQIISLHLQPQLIYFTHGHFDHISGALPLWLNFHCPVFLDQADFSLYRHGPLSATHFTGITTDPIIPTNQLTTSHQDITNLLARHQLTAQLIPTPGHTPGLTALYLPDQQLLFSGDLIFAGSHIGRTDFSYSDKQAMKTSLAAICTLPPATQVYPGHEDFFLLQDFHLRQ